MPLTHRRRPTLRQISAGGARYAGNQHSLDSLAFVVSETGTPRRCASSRCSNVPPRRREISPCRVTARRPRGTAGRNMEPDASRGRPFEGGFAGPPVPRYGLAARRTHLRLRIQKMPETACEICAKAYARPAAQEPTRPEVPDISSCSSISSRSGKTAGSTAPEARSFVHYAFAAHDASLYYMKNAALSAFMKKAAEYAASAGDKRTLVLIRFGQASATFSLHGHHPFRTGRVKRSTPPWSCSRRWTTRSCIPGSRPSSS